VPILYQGLGWLPFHRNSIKRKTAFEATGILRMAAFAPSRDMAGRVTADPQYEEGLVSCIQGGPFGDDLGEPARAVIWQA
jgi:hypothetical protein